MPSSCRELRDALAQCLQESDCIMVQRRSPKECLTSEDLPLRCQQLRKGLGDCKRGMIDMRRRFRGNQPIAYSRTVNEATGEVHEKREPVPQMYAGKPPVMVESETVKDGGSGFDPEKTRGF